MKLGSCLSALVFCGLSAFGEVDLGNRERLEWANFWWNSANDNKKPRVLIVGDSICNGASGNVYAKLDDVAYVDKFVSSKNVKDPALLKEMRYMLSEYTYKVIHFNHGLHGLRIKEDEYEGYLRAYVTEVVKLSRGARLIWGSITPLRGSADTSQNQLLKRRNAVAAKVMAEFGIPVDDLWGVIWGADNADAIRSDNKGDAYHYNGKGNELIAQAMADTIRAALKE